MTRSQRSPIAMDVGTRTVRAVQLGERRGKERLRAWARVPRHGEAWNTEEAGRVWEALRRQGFEGQDVLMVMPADDASASLLEFRGKSTRELDEATIRTELSRMQRVERESFEYCAWKAWGSGRTRGNEAWMTVSCSHERAENLVAPLDHLGVRIHAVDAGCFALARAVSKNMPSASLGVVVHASWECVRFVAVVDGDVVYERVLPGLGWTRFFERVRSQQGFELDVVSELLRAMGGQEGRRAGAQAGVVRLRPAVDEHMRTVAQELRQSLRYLEGGYATLPLAGVWVTGEGTAIGGWSKVIQGSTSAPTKVIGARDAVECDHAIPDEVGNELVLAIGLARHPREEEVPA